MTGICDVCARLLRLDNTGRLRRHDTVGVVVHSDITHYSDPGCCYECGAPATGQVPVKVGMCGKHEAEHWEDWFAELARLRREFDEGVEAHLHTDADVIPLRGNAAALAAEAEEEAECAPDCPACQHVPVCDDPDCSGCEWADEGPTVTGSNIPPALAGWLRENAGATVIDMSSN